MYDKSTEVFFMIPYGRHYIDENDMLTRSNGFDDVKF
jgi:hypothetical protein